MHNWIELHILTSPPKSQHAKLYLVICKTEKLEVLSRTLTPCASMQPLTKSSVRLYTRPTVICSVHVCSHWSLVVYWCPYSSRLVTKEAIRSYQLCTSNWRSRHIFVHFITSCDWRSRKSSEATIFSHIPQYTVVSQKSTHPLLLAQFPVHFNECPPRSEFHMANWAH